MMNQRKIVVFDLETLWIPDEWLRQDRAFAMGNWPGRTMKADINSIISFGYQVIGEEPGVVSSWEVGKDLHDDAAVCSIAYDILHDATDVVTHNGKRFDWKFLNTRLMINGLPELPKIKHHDTCAIARKHYSLFSNRLKDLAKHFTPERKVDTGGSELWTRVYQGDKAAMKDMSEYCKQDVVTTEAIFQKIKHHANLSNLNLFTDGDGCSTCGSNKYEKHGLRATLGNKTLHQRYRCRNCGSTWSVAIKKAPPLKSVS